MRVSPASLLSDVWRRGLDALFPPRCAGCGAFGEFLCPTCLAAMPRAQPPRCPACWMPVLSPAKRPGGGDLCRRCRRHPPAFEAARCPFVYETAARTAVHALKYEGVSAIGGAMAREMAGCLEEWGPPAAAVVPVPLTGARRRSRGYNQSQALARELSKLTGLTLVGGLLQRRKAAPPQARAADESARRANVAEAFAARPGAESAGPLLLVDDVMTSGATLDACARALRAAGHGPIFALTFARED